MAQLVAAELVTPQALDPIAREALTDTLHALHSRIFRNADRASFVRHVIDSKAEHTWIQLYRDGDGALGGYIAAHIYEREVDGRPVAIVRCQSGTLREHRGANLIAGFFVERVLRYRAAHPRRPLYLLGALIHPSSYGQIVRYGGDAVWPREGAETPAALHRLIEELGDAFGLPRIDPANPLVRMGGWQTIDSRADRAHWERCDRPGVQFFLRHNPGYAEGHALLTLVPLTLGVLTRALARHTLARSARRARGLAARARAGLAALRPAPASAAR